MNLLPFTGNSNDTVVCLHGVCYYLFALFVCMVFVVDIK